MHRTSSISTANEELTTMDVLEVELTAPIMRGSARPGDITFDKASTSKGSPTAVPVPRINDQQISYESFGEKFSP